MKPYLTNEQKAESWDRLQEFLIEACKPSAPGEHKIQVTVEGKLATKQEVLDAINGKQPVAKTICADCTTPAILCPNGNEPKDKVTKCNSKNARWVEKEPAHTSCADGVCPICNKTHTPAPAPAPKVDCKWSVDFYGNWFSSCGEAHVFEIGNPSENGYLFCPYCGKNLVMDLESMIKYPVEYAPDIADETTPLHRNRVGDNNRNPSRMGVFVD